jgi:hypothetical protein
MRESAATLNGLGLYGALAHAVADVQDRMGGLRSEASGREDLDATIRQLLRSRRG